MNSRVLYDSEHAASVCLGTIQARTHVQLALACQRSMIFGQTQNFDSPCNTCMATVEIWVMNVLTTWDIRTSSSHNVATRWIHNNFDASVCFDGCNNIAEVWQRLQRVRSDAASLSQNRS